MTVLPPALEGTPYPALVPKTDADGNDIAGIRLPDIEVPLATYTGWGLRAFPLGANEGCDAAGQKINFALTREERLKSGDPRLSLEERYPSNSEYVRAVAHAANELHQQRLLLEEDVAAYVTELLKTTSGNNPAGRVRMWQWEVTVELRNFRYAARLRLPIPEESD